MEAVGYADGACEGNPGPAAYGGVLYAADGTGDCGHLLDTVSAHIGHGTNNQAEYEGAIAVCDAALRHGVTMLTLYLDSQLVVRQINGAYKVKSSTLRPLHTKLLGLLRTFDAYTISHVPRTQNRVADKLAGDALRLPPPSTSSHS